MEMRGGYMRPPRERPGLMRPLVPLRGRGVMGMERMRLGPPLRPGLIRGGPPVPFVGRGMVIPPHARPRGMGPVMLPRPPIPPPGPMGPLGPRGMLPRPMLPPRPLGPDAINLDPSINQQIPLNGAPKPGNQIKNIKDVQNKPVNQNQQNRAMNKNGKIGNRMNKGNQGLGQGQTQTPIQNVHPAPHLPQPPNQSNPVINPHMQKPMHPIPPQMGAAGYPQPQPQPHPMQHQPAARGGRNGINARGRGGGAMGRGNLINAPPNVPNNRGNLMMNRGAPNMPPRGGASMPGRSNAMIGGPPPPPVQAPPNSYAAPPPIMSSQVPVKRGPPVGVPPVMQPKRIRYDTPVPANGYGQYQPPPPPQPVYSGYDVPPNDGYGNPPPSGSMPPSHNYSSGEYSNYVTATQQGGGYSSTVNTPYAYTNAPAYSNYSNQAGYDSPADYGGAPTQTAGDPYGYTKSVPVDSYGYSNTNYTNPQSGYEDYSTGYVDSSGYAAPMQDPSYGQSVGGGYAAYSY